MILNGIVNTQDIKELVAQVTKGDCNLFFGAGYMRPIWRSTHV
jgi:hypothetical protein